MKMEIRNAGVAKTEALSQTPTSEATAAPGPAELLPEPTGPVSPAMLATLMLQASRSSREAYRAVSHSQSQERQAAQADEIDKMHDEADNALIGGIVSGGFQAAGGAMKFAGSVDSNESADLAHGAKDADTAAANQMNRQSVEDANSAARWNAGADFSSAAGAFGTALNQAHGKELETDAKGAANRAEAAKEAHDEAAAGVREQRDLDQAFLQAYSALIGSQSQVWQATMGSRA